jgi:hypothetical protein
MIAQYARGCGRHLHANAFGGARVIHALEAAGDQRAWPDLGAHVESVWDSGSS